jgi:hypothetical protein
MSAVLASVLCAGSVFATSSARIMNVSLGKSLVGSSQGVKYTFFINVMQGTQETSYTLGVVNTAKSTTGTFTIPDEVGPSFPITVCATVNGSVALVSTSNCYTTVGSIAPSASSANSLSGRITAGTQPSWNLYFDSQLMKAH